jgi:hypothetical protein
VGLGKRLQMFFLKQAIVYIKIKQQKTHGAQKSCKEVIETIGCK